MKYNITIILINVVLTIIIGLVFFYPKYGDYSSISAKVENKKEEIENYQSYVNKISSVKREMEENSVLIEKVASAIPDDSEISSFLNFLTENNVGMSLEDIKWSEETSREEKGTKSYKVDLHVSGSYFSFKNFLFILENTARLVEVLDIKFDVPESEEGQMGYNLVLRIHSY